MSAVVFMPWATLTNSVEVGEFVLAPIRCAKLGPSELPACAPQVTGVFSAYEEVIGHPIASATQIWRIGTDPLGELADAEIGELFELRDAIGFCGLARRTQNYFNDLGTYSNFDTYSLVIQRFRPDSGDMGPSLSVRRRDGHTWLSHSKSQWRWIKAPHIQVERHFQFDPVVATAVLKKLANQDFGQAIHLFNNANTDNSVVDPAQEVIDAVSAFQRLLHNTDGYCRSTARAVERRFELPWRVPRLEISDPQFRWEKRRTKVLYAWMEDFCALRGSLGHGHSRHTYHSYWTLETHLLLASIIFPLAVKLELGFPLTDSERRQVLALDSYLLERNLLEPIQGEGLRRFAWHRAKERAEKAQSRLLAEQIRDGPK